MATSLWNPLSFTAGPLGAYEAVYLDEERLTKVPIIGVLIEEEEKLGPDGTIVRTGVTRSVMAQQTEPGSIYVEAAGQATNFVGVFEVGQEPPAEFVERARRAELGLDRRDESEDDEEHGMVEVTWPNNGWTGPVLVAHNPDFSGDVIATLPMGSIGGYTLDGKAADVIIPVDLMKWVVAQAESL